MSSPALRLRVRASRTPYRRAGIAFGNLPLVLGPEHISPGVDGMRALLAIVSDPVLKVQRSTVDGEDGDFVALRPDEIATLQDMLAGLEAGSDLAGVEYTASSYLRLLIGDTKLQSPEGPDAKGDDAAAPSPAADGKADGGTDENAAPAVEPPPASDASTAPDEQLRAGADASEAAPAADADAAKQPEDTQQPPVVEPEPGEPKTGDAVPAEAAAPATRKPRSSSGRKAAVPASAGGAKA